MGDRLLVQNSKAMQAILESSKCEAEASRQVALQSQRLSEEMMKDSVAMKTACLPLDFLVGWRLGLTAGCLTDRSFDHCVSAWDFICCKWRFVSF
jgi:hypothetical protein